MKCVTHKAKAQVLEEVKPLKTQKFTPCLVPETIFSGKRFSTLNLIVVKANKKSQFPFPVS